MGGERTVKNQRGKQEQTVHAGSAGTSMLPWMVCQCFLGSSARGQCSAQRHARDRALPRPPFAPHTAHDRWVSGLLRNGKVNKNRLFLTNMTDTVIAGGHRERTSAGTQRDARRLLPPHAGLQTHTHTHKDTPFLALWSQTHAQAHTSVR
jgi:hypothetical protein